MSGRDDAALHMPAARHLDALGRLWHMARGEHPRAAVAARFVLAMYAEDRFTFNLHDLMRLDGQHFEDCLNALATLRELQEPVQVMLARSLGLSHMNGRLELLACDWRFENRCSPGCEALIRAHLGRESAS